MWIISVLINRGGAARREFMDVPLRIAVCSPCSFALNRASWGQVGARRGWGNASATRARGKKSLKRWRCKSKIIWSSKPYILVRYRVAAKCTSSQQPLAAEGMLVLQSTLSLYAACPSPSRITWRAARTRIRRDPQRGGATPREKRTCPKNSESVSNRGTLVLRRGAPRTRQASWRHREVLLEEGSHRAGTAGTLLWTGAPWRM